MANAGLATKTSADKSSSSKLFGWMKRLKPKKSSNKSSKKRNGSPSPVTVQRCKKEQDLIDSDQHEDESLDRPTTNNDSYLRSASHTNDRPYLNRNPQTNDSFHSLPPEDHEMQTLPNGNRPKSNAPTLDTNPGTTHSDGVMSDGHSKAGTSGTMTGGMSTVSGGAGGSIFSSSNHSARSLSTTLTTIQSQPSNTGNAPAVPHGTNLGQHHNTGPASTNHSSQPSQSSTYFTHQYPTNPASAVPAHLHPDMHVPTTYSSATANNLLSDNASVLTLASSSHRPARRNSLDTNASIRAIAPSSVWGGSRESLSLSTLSQPVDGPSAPAASTPPSTAGITATSAARSISGIDRGSVHSAGGGVGAPALSSERNSIYAGKTKTGDGGTDGDRDKSSMRSGKMSHGRNDSIT